MNQMPAATADSPSAISSLAQTGLSRLRPRSARSLARADSRSIIRLSLHLRRRDHLLRRLGQPIRRDDVLAALGEERLALLDVGPLQPHDEWDVEADLVERREDRGGDRVALHDAAEDVDEYRLDVLVGEQDAERFGDLILV